MFELAFPWLLCAWPLPWVWRRFWPARSAVASPLRLPFYAGLQSSATVGISRLAWYRWLLPVLIWTCLVIAACRPQWLGPPVSQERAGRNIMLAIDISQSMALTDLDWQGREASRLQVVKAIAGAFIDDRVGDRIGLIVFGSKAYLQTPLTFDRQTVKQGLFDASIGLAGKQTAIGDALALSIKHLQAVPESGRVLVLLTDGVSNVGIDPLDGMDAAKQAKVKVYPIAFGHDNVRVDTLLGPRNIKLPFDESILKTMAAETGGLYFRAHDSKALKKVYQTLNALEKVDADAQVVRQIIEVYVYPAGAALLLLLLCLVGRLLRKMVLALSQPGVRAT